MKTFRMIGMALFAILVCVNFASCSSDDEPDTNEDGVVTNEKKLIEIKDVDSYGYTGSVIFSYDSKGKLIFKEGGVTGDTYYTWEDNIILAEDNWGVNTYTLNSQKLVEKVKSTNHGTEYFTYNSEKQLVSFFDDMKYYWENGKICKKTDGDEETIYTYSEKTCKGYFPLYGYYYLDDDYEISLVHPELFGLRNQYLPTKIYTKHKDGTECTERFTYTFDDDGYIETCTYTYNMKDKTIYTFIWK